MTPLQIQIIAGLKDGSLLHILGDLDRMRRLGGLSKGEEDTWFLAFTRLDVITSPTYHKRDGVL